LDSLGSDYHFRRQEARAGLEYHRRPHRLTIDLIGGNLHGRAPLPDRFAAGTTTVLRGWNKWELAPLGGERLIASAVEYGRTLKRRLEAAVFVDSGAIWNRTTTAVSRTSAGCGLRTSDGFFFYVAFPLRDGRIEPVFMTGANF
jgi:outer membrane translocation and assembly module TamA